MAEMGGDQEFISDEVIVAMQEVSLSTHSQSDPLRLGYQDMFRVIGKPRHQSQVLTRQSPGLLQLYH